MAAPPFRVIDDQRISTPVVIAVPHAGRAYPPGPHPLRAPLSALRPLEDRHADRLADRAIARGTPAIIADTPRLWIDLNRSEADLDPAMTAMAAVAGAPLSPRARGGLGLIPRRLAGVGEIWRLPLEPADVAARISTIHRAYHAALARLLARGHHQYGAAVLIDLHSMPPLSGPNAAQIVIGDRFGRSAGATITDCAEAYFSGLGYRVAVNAPYAGGYGVERHARPQGGTHALQIEIDRSLYLDNDGDLTGPGLLRLQDQIAALTDHLATRVGGPRFAIAAE